MDVAIVTQAMLLLLSQTHILHSTASSCEQNGHLKTVETTCFLRVWIFFVDFFRLPMVVLRLLLLVGGRAGAWVGECLLLLLSLL